MLCLSYKWFSDQASVRDQHLRLRGWCRWKRLHRRQLHQGRTPAPRHKLAPCQELLVQQLQAAHLISALVAAIGSKRANIKVALPESGSLQWDVET